MKYYSIFFIILITISCRRGPKEVTMKAIADFESEWSILGQQSLNWKKEVSNTLSNCNPPPCDTIEENENSFICSCEEYQKTFDSLEARCDSLLNSWNQTTARFDSWRVKIVEGNINDASANDTLIYYKKIYSQHKSVLESWTGEYNYTKEKYLNSCVY